MTPHEIFMSRCLRLAAMGMGAISPNPMVGAVLVHDGRIIGEGYHKQYGLAHAEVNCIGDVREQDRHLIPSSTLYVSLEPCAHYGLTPPCADLIIDRGIREVVTGSDDPNPVVAGRGIRKMAEAGIRVTTNVLREQCDFLNRRFITYHTLHRPYIILKWAQSADGFFAPDGGRQQWLTNEYSRKLVHKWRSEEDAVLIGTRTALIDDPQLTVRLWAGTNPVRVLIDMDLKVPVTARMFDDEAITIVYNATKEGLEYGIVYIKLVNDNTVPQQILEDLCRRKVHSLIIEGGSYTLDQFIRAGLWDEARIFVAPTSISRGIRAPQAGGRLTEEQDIAGDRLLIKLNRSL